MHLLRGAEGNFGPWGILDWIFGTAVGETIVDDIEAELEEREVEDSIRRAIDASKRKIREEDQKRRRGKREGHQR